MLGVAYQAGSREISSIYAAHPMLSKALMIALAKNGVVEGTMGETDADNLLLSILQG